MYQSELCDANRRGRLVSSEPLFVGVGIVIAYFFDYGMSCEWSRLLKRTDKGRRMCPSQYLLSLIWYNRN